MPTVDDQIDYLKRAQGQTDRGLPPYQHPKAVVTEDRRRLYIKRRLEEGATIVQIVKELYA